MEIFNKEDLINKEREELIDIIHSINKELILRDYLIRLLREENKLLYNN